MAQRVKGQEVEISIILNGSTLGTLTAIQSFEMSWKLETQSEGYLGEKTERKDSVYKGVSGKMDLHFEDDTILTLYQAVVDKAKRRLPGVTVNIKATLNFPSGRRKRIVIPDVEMGELPLSFGSRTDYGSAAVNFEASDAFAI